MATLQSGSSPGTRIEAGDKVLAAAGSVDTKPVAKRFADFKKIHVAYRAADAKVKKASDMLAAQQAKVAEADVVQDEAVITLASVLPADGLPRLNPFKPLGAPAPSELCRIGYGDEAKAVLQLEKAVLKRKDLSSASTAAAKKAGAAAKKVLSELGPIEKLEQARTSAIHARDALEQAWETAFAGLKRGVRAAEDEGAKGLFAALFERAAKPKAKAKSPKKAPNGAGAGAAATPG